IVDSEKPISAEINPTASVSDGAAEASNTVASAIAAATVLANAVPALTDHTDPAPATAAPAEKKEAKPELSSPTRETVQKSHTPAGKETVRSASVVVPRSYFVALYMRANRKQQEPDDALLQPVVDAHLARIRGLVKNALGLERDGEVTVEPYDDDATIIATAAPTAAPAPLAPAPVAPVAATAAAPL